MVELSGSCPRSGPAGRLGRLLAFSSWRRGPAVLDHRLALHRFGIGILQRVDQLPNRSMAEHQFHDLAADGQLVLRAASKTFSTLWVRPLISVSLSIAEALGGYGDGTSRSSTRRRIARGGSRQRANHSSN